MIGCAACTTPADKANEMVINKTIRLLKRLVFMRRPPFVETSVEDLRIAVICLTHKFSDNGIQEKHPDSDCTSPLECQFQWRPLSLITGLTDLLESRIVSYTEQERSYSVVSVPAAVLRLVRHNEGGSSRPIS
jgi:hypothetical protein